MKWATASSGGLTLIASGTLSGNSVVVSSISGYKSLFGIIESVTNDVGNNRIRMCPNSNDNTTYVSFTRLTTVASETFWQLSGDANFEKDNGYCVWNFYIDNIQSTTGWKPVYWSGLFIRSGAGDEPIIGGGAFRSNTAITSLQMKMQSASCSFTGGTYKIYGVN